MLTSRSSLLSGSVLLLATSLGLAGCHSAFVQATVTNHTGNNIRLFEVDYPNASFGAGELANGAEFRYRFKILDTGQAKLLWTDASGHDHTAQGPAMRQGLEGTLAVVIGPETATWQSDLHTAR